MLRPLYLFGLTLSCLTGISFIEKIVFAIDHSKLAHGLPLGSVAEALLWGLRFDFAVAAMFAFVAWFLAMAASNLLHRPLAKTLYVTTTIAAVLMIFLHGADMLYFGESGRHLGYELKEGINSASELMGVALHSYPRQFAFQVLLMVLAERALRFIFRRYAEVPGETHVSVSRPVAVGLNLVLALTIGAIFARGGFGRVPLEPLHAQELGNPHLAALALNGDYNAIFSSVTPYSVRPVFATPPDAATKAKVASLYAGLDKPTRAPIAGKPNVVVFLLESWTGAYIHSYGFPQEVTPNFDALHAAGLGVHGMFAGGKRTTEGMFASLCSWPNPLGNTVAQTQLQNYAYRCLPRILNEHGYHTALFQGTNKNTSGTGAFGQSLGFEDSYGKADIPNPQIPFNSWGAHDPDIYRFVLAKLKTMPKPFMISINTDTTHDDELPPGVKPMFPQDSARNRYLDVLHYADAALGNFMKAVRNDPDLKNTIFVLQADHCGGHTPTAPVENFVIPFVLYAPGRIAPGTLNRVSTQRDIAPTVLDLLGIPKPPQFTGISLLDTGTNPGFADFYYQGLFGWAEGNHLVEFSTEDPKSLRCLDLGPSMLHPPERSCTAADTARRDRGLAFAHVTQSLLFAGKTAEFAAVRKTADK